MNFQSFHFDERLNDGLRAMGFNAPTPIQQQAIPVILDNRDLIACAQTGTGKTAAYVLPVIHKIMGASHTHLDTLVIAPTRELAQQIDQQIEGFAYFAGASSIAVYGGGDGALWEQQKKALEKGVDIVIATPGRLIALLAGGSIDLSHCRHLILDEADRMLDMGFLDDILKIISYLPKERQTILFSATMPPKIRQLAAKILRDPKEVTLAVAKPAAGIDQQAYIADDEQKLPLLIHILKTQAYASAIIFASRKETVKKLDKTFHRAKINAYAFHSDLEQSQREEMMRAFRNKQINIIVGTDVLSRGIDVEGVGLVVNWDCPRDPQDYVHRVGRTARAEATGAAITFVNARDAFYLRQIEELIEKPIARRPLPEHIGVSPEIDERAFAKERKPFKRRKRRQP